MDNDRDKTHRLVRVLVVPDETGALQVSVVQFILITGFFLGSLVLAYGIGFFHGQDDGFQSAMAKSVREQIPTPIPESERASLFSDELAASLYAKLGDGFETEETESSVGKDSIAKSKKTKNKDTEKEDGPPPLLKLSDEPPLLFEQIEDAENPLNESDAQEESVELNKPRPSLGELLGKTAPTEKEKAFVRALGTNEAFNKDDNNDLESEFIVRQDEAKEHRQEVVSPPDVHQVEKTEIKSQPQETVNIAKMKAIEPVPASKQPSPPILRSQVASGWYAQISAPQEIEVARRLVSQLESSGFPAVIEPAEVRGIQYYRVLVGPEPDRTLARRLLSQVSREPFVEGSPFIKQIQ